MKIVFATNNAHKLIEAKQVLGQKITIIDLKEVGCYEDIPETSPTIEGNASQKSLYVYNNYHENCFADDTGLEIEALNGEPGVYSARYAGENVPFSENMKLVLQKMKNQENRNARFKTVVSLVINGLEKQFTGSIEGEIMQNPNGTSGFGYDPIFKPKGYDKTFAQMTAEQKNSISHRGQAIAKLAKYLETINL